MVDHPRGCIQQSLFICDDVHKADDSMQMHSGCTEVAGTVDLLLDGRFAGPVATVKCFEDNTLVKAALDTPGQGRVHRWWMAVHRCARALVGGNLAAAGARNGWAGWSSMAACGMLRSCGPPLWASAPWGSIAAADRKRNEGQSNVAVADPGRRVPPAIQLYADRDGIVVDCARPAGLRLGWPFCGAAGGQQHAEKHQSNTPKARAGCQ